VPQSVTIVNRAVMDSQGASSLADALRNVPGITIGGAEGGQIGNNINLNGFSARTDIYLDGFRDRGQYYRDTFALDQVEVLMGPSSMLFGRGSTGGIINQVSKKPQLKAATEVTGSVTTNGLVRATADVNTPTGDTSAFRISAMAQDGKPSTRDEMTVQDFGIAPSWRFGIGTSTEITLSALLQHNEDMPDYGLPPSTGTRSTSTATRTTASTTTARARTSPRFRPASRTSSRRTCACATRPQFNYVPPMRETAPNAVGTINAGGFTALTTTNLPLSQLYVRQQSHDRNIRDYSIFNQTELTAEFDTGPVKHTLLTGLELGHDGYNNQNYYRNGSCGSTPLNANGATTGYVACTPVVDPVYRLTGHVAERRQPAGRLSQHGRRLRQRFDRVQQAMEGGGRPALRPIYRQHQQLDQLRQHQRQHRAAVCQPDRQLHERASGRHLAADGAAVVLRVVWHVVQPVAGTTGRHGGPAIAGPGEEQIVRTGRQVGSAQWRLAVNSAIFRITKDNARSQIDATTYALTGKIQVDGFRLGMTGRITKWQVFAGYTYLDGVIENGVAAGTEGKVPLNTPKHTATAWTSYAILPSWEIGGGAFYMSQRYANNTNTVQVGGYVRWDGMIAYHQPKYDVRLNLFNIFDKKYYDALIQSDGGRSVPGTGRTAMLSFTYRM
jgi:catecholate siderophore receptor